MVVPKMYMKWSKIKDLICNSLVRGCPASPLFPFTASVPRFVHGDAGAFCSHREL